MLGDLRRSSTREPLAVYVLTSELVFDTRMAPKSDFLGRLTQELGRKLLFGMIKSI